MVTNVKAMSPTARSTLPMASQNSDSTSVNEHRRSNSTETCRPPYHLTAKKFNILPWFVNQLGLSQKQSDVRVANDNYGNNGSHRNLVCPKLDDEVEGNNFVWDQSSFKYKKVDASAESECWIDKSVGESNLQMALVTTSLYQPTRGTYERRRNGYPGHHLRYGRI